MVPSNGKNRLYELQRVCLGRRVTSSRRHLPVIISNDDDDLVSVSELVVRTDPAPTAVTATAIPAASTHKRQISEAVPRDERPNRPETTPAAPPQQASGGSQEAQGADTDAGTGAGTGR